MRSIISKSALAALLLAFFVGCVQPPTPPSSDIEVSDENNNTVTTQAIPTNGLKGDYYDNLDFTGTLKTRYDATINKAFNASAPITGIQPTTYSVRWTGQIMPAFSQTYTFYVTSSDGARLMVNGQVLVNDWLDGSSRVRSGTVTLQANTKYDIRLEYYRNATNAGAVKLEWQSSSRSKQVVPQASLFVGYANAQTAFSVLSTNAKFVALKLTLPLELARVTLTNEGNFSLITTDQTGEKMVWAVTNRTNILGLYVFSRSSNQGIFSDVLNDRKVELGALSAFANADGTYSDSQLQALASKLVSFFSQGALTANVTAPTTAIDLPRVHTQWAELIPHLCDLIPPPAFCSNRDCEDRANNYRNAVCGVGYGSAEILIALIPGGQTAAVNATWTAIKYSIGGSAPLDVLVRSLSLSALWQEYLDCIAGKLSITNGGQTFPIVGCAPIIQLPPPIEVTEALGISGSRPFSITNSAQSQSVLVIDVKLEGSSNNGLDVGVRLNSTPDFPILTMGGKLRPGTSASNSVYFTCPNAPTVWTGNLIIYHNAVKDSSGSSVANPAMTKVQITCGGGPKISVSPSSLSLVAAINSSTMGTLTVSNTGTAPLEVSGVASNQGWLTVPTTGFTVAPGSSQPVPVTGACDATAGTKPSATVTFSSNATSGSSPLQIPATLQCVDTSAITVKITTGLPPFGIETNVALVPRGQVFITAEIKNDASDRGVTWIVDGPGSINPDDATKTAIYTAPPATASYPAFAVVKITAKSKLDPSKVSNVFTVTLLPIQWELQVVSVSCNSSNNILTVNVATKNMPGTTYGNCGDDPRDIASRYYNVVGDPRGKWVTPEEVNAWSYDYNGHKVSNSEVLYFWVPVAQLP